MTNRFDYALPTPAAGGEVLFVELVSADQNSIVSAAVNGDYTRRFLELGSIAGNGYWEGRLYRLAAGDSSLIVIVSNPATYWFVGVHVVADEAVIPADYSANMNSGSAGFAPVTASGWPLHASGLLVATCMILGSDSTVVDVPPSWTVETSQMSSGLSVAHAYRLVSSAAVAPAESWSTTADFAWQVVTVPVYDVTTRFREAGAWMSGGLLRVREVASAPGREFVAPSDGHRLPPDPSRIVVPTEPWVPDGGPFRRS